MKWCQPSKLEWACFKGKSTYVYKELNQNACLLHSDIMYNALWLVSLIKPKDWLGLTSVFFQKTPPTFLQRRVSGVAAWCFCIMLPSSFSRSTEDVYSTKNKMQRGAEWERVGEVPSLWQDVCLWHKWNKFSQVAGRLQEIYFKSKDVKTKIEQREITTLLENTSYIAWKFENWLLYPACILQVLLH